MLILSGKDIGKSYGTDIILEDVSFSVNKGDRIGIVGPNGSGKTTLLSIIAGEIQPTLGEIYLRNEFSVGYLHQKNHFLPGGTLLEEAQKTFRHLADMEKETEELRERIENPDSPTFEKDLERYTYLNEEYGRQGGYTYKSELTAVLKHMGFGEAELGKKVETLSGGERTRLALACMLLSKPDILMLDEPTNHLDLKMLSWLESYLSAYKGTLLVVSHDRYFLDRIVNRIFDMSAGTLDEYTGNYTAYLEKRAARLEAMRREYEKQQKEIARQEEMIRRFKQHGTEHLVKRAQSREKRLAHIKRLERPKDGSDKIKLSFDADYKSGNEVITAEGLSKSYDGRLIFDGADLSIRKGERVCIIGDNGVGKTTLLRILTGSEQSDGGYLKIGYNVNFGYYDQGQLLLDDDETVLGEMKNAYHLYTDTEMRSLLGRFLFRGDDVFKKVGSLSGGEKAKLSLLKLMLSGANTLVLDEPTNHLDIESKEIVEDAVAEFGGTVIIVSHDRYLLTKIPDRILELTQHGINEYKGNFGYYLEKTGAGRTESDVPGNDAPRENAAPPLRTAEDERQAKKQQEAEERRRARQEEDIESRIHELEGLAADIQVEMSMPERALDFEWMTEQSEQLAKYEDEISELYDKWMELQ